jgi:GTP cyclohydrolase I
MIEGKFQELVHSPATEAAYEKFKRAYGLILSGISDLGYDTINDSNFHETDQRAALSLLEMIMDQGRLDLVLKDIKRATFDSQHDNLVAVYDIRSTGVCPHHLLPVLYSFSVGYVPEAANCRVEGLSKLSRLVKALSKRPACQETLVNIIADYLFGESSLIPTAGCVVSSVGIHSCMRCRGVEDQTSHTVINAVRGIFLDNKSNVRDEFLRRAERITDLW